MRPLSGIARAWPVLLLFPACSAPSNPNGKAGAGGSAGQTLGPAGAGGSGNASGTGSAGMPQASTGGAGGSGGSAGTAGQGGTSNGGMAPSAGGPGLGGRTSGGAGAGPIAGTGGGASGAVNMPSGGMSGSAGTGGAAPETWHAAIAPAITDSMLATEYSTWKSRHVESCSDGSSVVKKDAGSVVSEGIGYGMLLAAAFDDRALFDGLWQYYLDHADPNGLMNWATGVCDAKGNNNAFAATDGDLDTLMALVQAAARWPDGDYLGEAEALGAKIIESETEVCGSRAVLRPGDNYGGCSDASNPKLNPSYFAPGYYRVFAARFPAQAERWTALRAGSYELYPLYQARMSGLVPDWAALDGGDWYGASYSYDACRTPWRVMVDYAWSGEPEAKTFLEGVTGWTDQNGLGSMPNNSAFVGSFALAAAYDQSKLDTAVAAWLAGNGDDNPYFQGTLRVLYLLAAAGKFPSTL